MFVDELITLIKDAPDTLDFDEVIATIDAHYQYTPTGFTNGLGATMVANEAGTNEGSCKIFAFAQLKGLDQLETLSCFGDYYRHDVLEHPKGSDHQNIRQFMQYGWDGIDFDGPALESR